MTNRSDYISVFSTIADLAFKANVKVFLVGGFVRDLLLGSDLNDLDLDFLVEGDIYQLGQLIALEFEGKLLKHENFLTAKISLDSKITALREVDLAHARQELYSRPGALPEVLPASLEQDLGRRDFAINAIALPLVEATKALSANSSAESEQIARLAAIDPHRGIADLDNRIVRILHPRSFIDDPTRIFRAAKYCSRLRLELEPETKILLEAAISNNCYQTLTTSRILREINHFLDEPCFFACLETLQQWRALPQQFFPKEFPMATFLNLKTRRNLLSVEELKDLLLCAVVFSQKEKELPESEALYRAWNIGKRTIKKVRSLKAQAEGNETEEKLGTMLGAVALLGRC